MDAEADLQVRVHQRGENYVWELYRDGESQPLKFSVPIYASEAAAKDAGNAARLSYRMALTKKRRPRKSAHPSAASHDVAVTRHC